MRVVYFGSGDFAVPTLRWLINSRHDLLLVVTQPDRPAGRGKTMHPTPVAQRAAQEGVETLKSENVNTPEFISRIKALHADIAVVAAFGQKLLEPLRTVFPVGCINLHSSLLPKFRGAAPINAAILAGEPKTGVSVFRLVDRMDAGPVLLQRQTMIGSTETAGELHDRLAGVCCDAIGASLDLLEKQPDFPGQPQDESQVTYAKKLKKSDGFLDFAQPAENLARLIRAMWPWPGARCRYIPAQESNKAVEMTLITATAVPKTSTETPGTLSNVLTAATGEGALEIHSVQPAGSRPMSWQEFVNGRHVKPGDRLEKIELRDQLAPSGGV